MDESTEKPRLLVLAELLNRHGVEFLVIGGEAAALDGSPLGTTYPNVDADGPPMAA